MQANERKYAGSGTQGCQMSWFSTNTVISYFQDRKSMGNFICRGVWEMSRGFTLMSRFCRGFLQSKFTDVVNFGPKL